MAKEPTGNKEREEKKPVCGIVMPISAIPPKYDASHWSDVRKVLDAAITEAGMVPQIVSDSFESDVIQSRIIHNLYDNEMVVCDVSGLNPNVMFELGMRLTFNKPVVIVTDDFSNIPFDTKVIEHVGYPPDLHIHKTVEFQKKLTGKIEQILSQVADKKYKSPLAAFGSFQVFQPTTESVPGEKYVAERMDDLFAIVSRLEKRVNLGGYPSSLRPSRNALTSFATAARLVITSDKEMPQLDQKKLLYMDNVESVSSSRYGSKYQLDVLLSSNDVNDGAILAKRISKILGSDASIEVVIP